MFSRKVIGHHRLANSATLAGITAVVALIATLATSSPAAAQGRGGNIDLNQFRPAMDSRGYFTVEASQTLGSGEFSFGLGALDWSHDPLTFKSADGHTYGIQNMFAATLVGAIGFKLAALDMELGASVPFVIMNGDRGPDFIGDPQNPNDNLSYGLSGQGIGNIGLHLKTRFLKTTTGPRIGLALILSAYLPTVTQSNAFLGEGSFMPQGILVLDKEFGKEGRFRVSLNGGVRYRTKTETFTDTGDPGQDNAPATNQTISAGVEFPFSLGLSYAISPQKFDVLAEVFGAFAQNKQNYFPLEAIGGAKFYLARNSFLSMGAGAGLNSEGGSPDLRAFIGIVFEPNIGDRDGDGIKDDVDKCPDDPEDFDGFPDADGCPDPDNDRDGIPDVDDKCPLDPETRNGFQDEDGCPDGVKGDRDGDGIPDDVDKCPDDPEDKDDFEDADGCPDPDNDKDGILDVDDLCPNDPEDKDGFEDADGCPDPDNDKDRILDKDDKCPNEPETYNGVEDADGCPDRGRVVVTDTKIEILDKVYFEYNKDIIKKESYPILDAVAATLQGNPDIKLIEIQGHTDERGNDAYNLDLSDRRSKSVRKYLIDKGVNEDRLTAQGYGETQPVDPHHNEQAWAANRRVEFLILKRSTD